MILQSSICETAGQCGSGKGDLSVLIQTAALGTFGMNDYFVFYSEYGSAEAGFEEWQFRDAPGVVPLPPALLLLSTAIAGLAGFAGMRRRKDA